MQIKIQKFDPAVDAEPYYAEGEIEYREHMSALEALIEFYEQYEPVAYDMSCAGRTCGRCAMMLDGVPTMICTAPIEDKSHTFEPLASFPVIKDLVVDKNHFLDKVVEVSDRVRLEPFNRETLVIKGYDPSVKDTMAALEMCCRCGLCTVACPVHTSMPEEFVGPTVMLATAFRHFDKLDVSDRLTEAVSNGLYRCIQCGKCDEVCPQNTIKHLEIWSRLREEAEAAGLKPSYAE